MKAYISIEDVHDGDEALVRAVWARLSFLIDRSGLRDCSIVTNGDVMSFIAENSRKLKFDLKITNKKGNGSSRKAVSSGKNGKGRIGYHGPKTNLKKTEAVFVQQCPGCNKARKPKSDRASWQGSDNFSKKELASAKKVPCGLCSKTRGERKRKEVATPQI